MDTVILAPEALADIRDMCEHAYAANDTARAEALLDALEGRIAALGTPSAGDASPDELVPFGNRIICEVQESPWRIIYRREPGAVFVLGVFDRNRSLHDLLHGRLLRA